MENKELKICECEHCKQWDDKINDLIRENDLLWSIIDHFFSMDKEDVILMRAENVEFK